MNGNAAITFTLTILFLGNVLFVSVYFGKVSFLFQYILNNVFLQGSSLNILRQAASNYILTSVESGSWLGIVQFNTVASRLSPLVEVKNNADRMNLINNLPYYAEGKTSIGAGLGEGLKVY